MKKIILILLLSLLIFSCKKADCLNENCTDITIKSFNAGEITCHKVTKEKFLVIECFGTLCKVRGFSEKERYSTYDFKYWELLPEKECGFRE